MSIQAVAWALEQEDVPARPKLVLVSLANHASHTDGYCWLKAETIAKEAACKKRSVYRFVGDLIRNGFVRKAVRRGADGKQRANDYWLLLDRQPAKWVSVGQLEEESDEVEETEDTTSGDPGVQNAPGESEDSQPIESTQSPSVSPGPGDQHSTPIDAEPSKTKPEEARASGYVPRAYRPPPQPPPQPVGAVVGAKAELIFVFEGTRAYEAWAKLMAARNGVTNWHCTTSKVVNGESRRGWYFPSLFPPPTDTGTHGGSSDPPDDDPLADERNAVIKKTG